MSARFKSKELADKAVRAPVRRWFMAPTRVQILEVFPSHEPESGLPALQRLMQFRFMGREQVRKEHGAFHDPPLTPSLSPSEGERVPEGRVRGMFIAPMSGWKTVGTPHEPGRTSNIEHRMAARSSLTSAFSVRC